MPPPLDIASDLSTMVPKYQQIMDQLVKHVYNFSIIGVTEFIFESKRLNFEPSDT